MLRGRHDKAEALDQSFWLQEERFQKKVPGLIEDFPPWLPQGQVLGAWLLVAVAMRLARARELEASEAGEGVLEG